MSSFSGYKTTAFKETQKFFVLDPATGSPSFVQGSDLVSYLRPSLNSVDVETTTDAAVNADYDVGKVIQTTGESSPGDGNPGLFLVVASGTGGIPMLNGNELLVLEGANTALGISYDNTASGLSAENVQAAIDENAGDINNRVIFVDSVAELEALTTSASDVAYLSKSGRSGEFVFLATDQSAKVTADPKQGIFVAPSSDPTGASGAWMRRYDGLTNNGGVDARWFVEDTDLDETAAFQAAVNYAESDVTGSVAVRWQGQLDISAGITIGTASILVAGENPYRDLINWTGTGFLFTCAGIENRFENFRVIGDNTNDYLISSGNVTQSNVRLDNLNVGVEWNGGFYHKYYNCRFISVAFPLKDFNSNNFLASGCQFATCTDVANVDGGFGNMAFHGCSFENVTGDCFKQTGGSTGTYAIDNNYFEGCDEILVAARSCHIFTNNNIQVGAATSGVRLAGAEATNPVSIIGHGNKWIVASDGLNNMSAAYKLSGERASVYLRDFWVPTGAPFAGSFTTEFASGVGGFDVIDAVDAISGIRYGTPWVTMTLENSWGFFGSGANFDNPAYKVQDGVLYLKGKLLRDPATADTFTTLPTSITQYLSTEDLTPFSASGLEGSVSASTGECKLPTGTGNIVLDIALPLTR